MWCSSWRTSRRRARGTPSTLDSFQAMCSCYPMVHPPLHSCGWIGATHQLTITRLHLPKALLPPTATAPMSWWMQTPWDGERVLREHGWEHAWGIGRHILGSQIFDYWRDPWGDKHEHYCDGDLFTADLPMGLHEVSREAMSQWGQPCRRASRAPTRPFHGGGGRTWPARKPGSECRQAARTAQGIRLTPAPRITRRPPCL